MNYLQTPEADRPRLPTRQRLAGKIEVLCPACGCWRPGFALQPVPGGGPADWPCDNEISKLNREAL